MQGKECAAVIGGDAGRSSLQMGPGVPWISGRAVQKGGGTGRDARSSRDAVCCIAVSNKLFLDMSF